jgi:hypothetical protein
VNRIINNRGLIRPSRTGDAAAVTPDPAVTDTTLPSVQGGIARPLPPVARRDVFDDVPQRETGEAASQSISETGPASTELPLVGVVGIGSKSPVSSVAVAQLIGALERHQQLSGIVHAEALLVLQRLKARIDHVTERRSWPKVPRVRRRLQRKRREP